MGLLGIANILKGALVKVVMAFFGEKLIGKAVFGLLKQLAASTKNELDDEIVADAKARFMKKR